MAKQSQTLKNSHAVPHGPTIIQRIEKQMDKRRNALEGLREKEGVMLREAMDSQSIEQGRYEGFAAALSLLRSSSVGEEISRSNERLGID